MTIYFTFSDESGNYKQERNHRFNQKHPYYIRASFIMQGDEWQYLDNLFWNLKREFDLPPRLELKYSDLWRLEEHTRHPESDVDPRLRDLLNYPLEGLRAFIEKAINLVSALDEARIILTISKNDWCGIPCDKDMYTWHVQNLMQRIQKDLVSPDGSSFDNLCVIFIDPVSPRINRLLTESYNELFVNGDRFTTFSTIKDCLHFELSHHSCGIQIADYIAGMTYGSLQGGDYSIGVFNRQIRPLIREGPNGKIMGYGIIEIPSNSRVRTFLSEGFQVD
jgi:hypothetical protein